MGWSLLRSIANWTMNRLYLCLYSVKERSLEIIQPAFTGSLCFQALSATVISVPWRSLYSPILPISQMRTMRWVLPGSHLDFPACKAVAVSATPSLYLNRKKWYLSRAKAQGNWIPSLPSLSDTIIKYYYLHTYIACRSSPLLGTSWRRQGHRGQGTL